MKSNNLRLCFAVSTAFCFGSFIQADDSVELPEQYTEAVLNVEGMV